MNEERERLPHLLAHTALASELSCTIRRGAERPDGELREACERLLWSMGAQL